MQDDLLNPMMPDPDETGFDFTNPALMMGLSLLANPRNPGQGLLAGAEISRGFQRDKLQRQQFRQQQAEREQMMAMQQAQQDAEAEAARVQERDRAVLLANMAEDPNVDRNLLNAVAGGFMPIEELFKQPESPFTGEYANIAAANPQLSGQEVAAEVQRLNLARRAASRPETNLVIDQGGQLTPTQKALMPSVQESVERTIEGGRLARENQPYYAEALELLDIVGETGPLVSKAQPIMRALNIKGSDNKETLENLLLGVANRIVQQFPGVATDEDFQRVRNEVGSLATRKAALRRSLNRVMEQSQRAIAEQTRFQTFMQSPEADIFQYDFGGSYTTPQQAPAMSTEDSDLLDELRKATE